MHQHLRLGFVKTSNSHWICSYDKASALEFGRQLQVSGTAIVLGRPQTFRRPSLRAVRCYAQYTAEVTILHKQSCCPWPLWSQRRACISMKQVLVTRGPCSWSRTTRNCKFASIRVLEVQYYDMTLAPLTDVPGLAVWLSRRGCRQRRRRQSRGQSSLSPRRTFNIWVDLDAACTARLHSTAGSIAIVMKCPEERLYTFKLCVLGMLLVLGR